MIIKLEQSNTNSVVKTDEIALGKTLKRTCARVLSTIDESSRILEVTAKDIRLGLELVEIQLHIAKGSALIDGVQEFMSKGMSNEDANTFMAQLRAE